MFFGTVYDIALLKSHLVFLSLVRQLLNCLGHTFLCLLLSEPSSNTDHSFVAHYVSLRSTLFLL